MALVLEVASPVAAASASEALAVPVAASSVVEDPAAVPGAAESLLRPDSVGSLGKQDWEGVTAAGASP